MYLYINLFSQQLFASLLVLFFSYIFLYNACWPTYCVNYIVPDVLDTGPHTFLVIYGWLLWYRPAVVIITLTYFALLKVFFRVVGEILPFTALLKSTWQLLVFLSREKKESTLLRKVSATLRNRCKNKHSFFLLLKMTLFLFIPPNDEERITKLITIHDWIG